MAFDDEWSLTIQLGDPNTKRISTESISFKLRETAVAQLATLSGGAIIRPAMIYTVENEDGEQISFLGQHYLSHSLKNVTPIEIDFD